MQTIAKAGGRPRFLLVDGHNSHYSLSFLTYAWEHRIHVLCYPLHTTHVYQALDVGVFGALKAAFLDERDSFKCRLVQKVSKENFLVVLGAAWVCAMTPDTIKNAFRITGVVPFNWDAIRKDALAPSLKTTTAAAMPLTPPSPVRVIARVFHDLSHPTAGSSTGSVLNQTPPCPEDLVNAVSTASSLLLSTSAAFLVTASPVASTLSIPSTPFQPLHTPPCPAALNLEPKTENERLLLQLLKESHAKVLVEHENSVSQHARLVLQDLYCDWVRGQLFAREAKKKKGKGKKRLMGNGLPVLLTGDVFFDRVVKHNAAEEAERKEHILRAKAWEIFGDVLGEWKAKEEARKSRNIAIRFAFKEAKMRWDTQAAEAKAIKQRPPLKPKQGKLEKPVPRPVDPSKPSKLASDKSGPQMRNQVDDCHSLNASP
jgi:hypothetical protein